MKLQIPFLVLSVGQACNLRCKNCANFAPYALPEMRRYSIISDFESLFTAVGKIQSLQIQGGEPLIHKDLPKLVAYLAACPEIEYIQIATNGMMMPSDALMYICHVMWISFRVSNYPQNIKNLPSWIEKAKRLDDDSVVAKRFNHCSFKFCNSCR